MDVDVALILRRVLPIVAITATAAAWAAPALADDNKEDAARVQRAITYLDARQDAWSQFQGAQRGEGTDRTSCVSCHTGISYALARPALRTFVASPVPAEQEERMIAAVSLRVEHWAELDSPRYRLMYDGNDRKKVESRGTEPVLNALILARADAARGRTAPAAITNRAIQQMWEAQTTEGSSAGSWTWLNFGLEPWEADGSRAFGAALAAIAVGSAPGYLDQTLDERASRGLRSLRDYLRRRFPEENLYNRLWILESSLKFEGLLSTEQKQDVVDQLLAVRRDDGGWSLAALGAYQRVDGTAQTRETDGYATGLALHVLLRAGTPTDRPEIARGLDWLRTHQRDDGSWPGRSVNKERDPATFVGKLMSDAATAIAALALTEAGPH